MERGNDGPRVPNPPLASSMPSAPPMIARRRGGRLVARGARDGREVQQISAVDQIKPGHGVAAALQVLGHDTTDRAQMSGDENAHHDKIALPGPRAAQQAATRAAEGYLRRLPRPNDRKHCERVKSPDEAPAIEHRPSNGPERSLRACDPAGRPVSIAQA